MTRPQIRLPELSVLGTWIKEERIYYSKRVLQLHQLLVTWAQAGSQASPESPTTLQGADIPVKARGRAALFEDAIPESQAVLGLQCHGCSRWWFFDGWILCYPVLRNARLGCIVIFKMKSSQSCWREWWSVMVFPYPACQADFLARAVNSLLALCPWEVQRCNSVSSTIIHGAGKKNGYCSLVQSFGDKAELSFSEQWWS